MNESRRLRLALAITAAYLVAEVVGGLVTNSLALLSDAGHMLCDVGALALSLFAFRMAQRPTTAQKTYGYYRLEILAGLINGLTLWLIVGIILHEAYRRFIDPPEVKSLEMLLIASVGLGVNLAAGWILLGSRRGSLNVRSAFVHVLGDAVGSVGAMAAGLTMFLTGWYLADPVISVLISVLILYTSWSLVRESVSILMQSCPEGISLKEVQDAIEGVGGVVKVHDLHIWVVTSGVFTLTAHAVTDGGATFQNVLNDIEILLKNRFHIEHTTIQLEIEDRAEKEFQAF